MRFVLLITGSAILLGCQPKAECAPGDYNCNLRAYQDEIWSQPPDYSRASQLAQSEQLARNVQNVLRADDKTASSMLRVLHEYPPETRRQLCSDGREEKALQRRGRAIKDPFEFQEYSGVFESMGCRP